MFILFIVVALAVAGISGTVLALLKDGYRPVPTDDARLPAPTRPEPGRPAREDARGIAHALHRTPLSTAR